MIMMMIIIIIIIKSAFCNVIHLYSDYRRQINLLSSRKITHRYLFRQKSVKETIYLLKKKKKRNGKIETEEAGVLDREGIGRGGGGGEVEEKSAFSTYVSRLSRGVHR